MAAGENDITVEQGSTYKKLLTFYQDTAQTITVDLTGYTFRGQIRTRYDGSSALASFTFTLRDQTTNEGEVYVEVSATDTALIPVNSSTKAGHALTKYTYDWELIKPNGEVNRFAEGLCYISPEATR